MCLENGISKCKASVVVKELTRIAFPIEIVLRVAMTFQVEPQLLSSWTMGEGYMIIGYVIEKVDLLFLEEKACSNGVDWCITPSFIKESAILVQGFKEVSVSL